MSEKELTKGAKRILDDTEEDTCGFASCSSSWIKMAAFDRQSPGKAQDKGQNGIRCEPEMEPTEAKALNDRGWKHLCQGRRHEALEDFSRAIELDEELAEAYNNRSIARRLEGAEGAAEDEDLADALTMHDLEAQMQLRQQRKWMCIGYNARGEPEGEKLATDADFLISFASPDKDENNRILHELKTGVNYDGGLRPVTFCTDKSLGMGLHINEAQEMRRWNPIFSDLDQPQQPGEYPPWFKHYKEAANETRHGLLILQLTDSYLQSKACRWEFGYVRKPELVHVYVPSGDNSPGRIVKWEELMEDVALCRQLFGEALGTFQGNLDAEDPTMQGTFTQLHKMAKTAEEQEHQAWCELPFRQLAYNFAANTFGEESVDTMFSAGNLIVVFLQTGFAAKAQEIGKDLLEKTEKKFGKDHLNVANTLANLGNAHGNLGDYCQQKDLLERALRIEEQHYGKDHPEVAATLINLGNAHESFGDSRQQKDLLERALIILEQHYGKDHPHVAKTLTNLGNAHGSLGDHRQKKDLLERALRIKEQHYGKEHPEVALTLTNLGNAHGSLGNSKQQKDLLQRALMILEQHYGKDHPQVAKTLVNLGNAHGRLGDYRQKKDLLERALRIQEQHYGKDHPEVADTLANLGIAHGNLGNYSQQKDLLERALRIKEQHYGKDHPDVATTLGNLGNAHGDLGDYRQKKDLLERALRIEEQHYGKDHPEVAITLTNLGIAHGSLGDHRQKKDLLERALRIKEQHYGKDHPEVAITVYNLGVAHDSLGDLRRAKELVERAFKIFVHHGSPYADTAQRCLAQMEVKMMPSVRPSVPRGFVEDVRRSLQDDEDLQKALALSLEPVEDDEDLQKALALSLEPLEDVEDPELREALALSMSPLDGGS